MADAEFFADAFGGLCKCVIPKVGPIDTTIEYYKRSPTLDGIALLAQCLRKYLRAVANRQAQFERFDHLAELPYPEKSAVQQVIARTGLESDAGAAFAWGRTEEVYINLMRDTRLKDIPKPVAKAPAEAKAIAGAGAIRATHVAAQLCFTPGRIDSMLASSHLAGAHAALLSNVVDALVMVESHDDNGNDSDRDGDDSIAQPILAFFGKESGSALRRRLPVVEVAQEQIEQRA